MIDFNDMKAVESAMSPPSSDQDRVARSEGWKAFLEDTLVKARSDPNIMKAIGDWGARMAQPIRPGETGMSKASNALTAATDNLDAQAIAQSEAAQKALEMGLKMRGADQTDEQLSNQRRGQDIGIKRSALEMTAGVANREDEQSHAVESATTLSDRQDTRERLKRELSVRLHGSASASTLKAHETAQLKGSATSWAKAMDVAWEIEKAAAEQEGRAPNADNVITHAAGILNPAGRAEGVEDPMLATAKEYAAASPERKAEMERKLTIGMEGQPAAKAAALMAAMKGAGTLEEEKAKEKAAEAMQPLDYKPDVKTTSPDDLASYEKGQKVKRAAIAKLAGQERAKSKPARVQAAKLMKATEQFHAFGKKSLALRKKLFVQLQEVYQNIPEEDMIRVAIEDRLEKLSGYVTDE
jgi:hypothetical protein